jgi:poly(3-hydroxybutyrate) depolymerase
MTRPMIRNTVLGLAAAATMAVAMATSASTASAGAKIQFSFGVPAYGYGYGYHAPYGYRAPLVGYHHCPKVFVGYRKVHTHYGWKTKPVYRRHCGY